MFKGEKVILRPMRKEDIVSGRVALWKKAVPARQSG